MYSYFKSKTPLYFCQLNIRHFICISYGIKYLWRNFNNEIQYFKILILNSNILNYIWASLNMSEWFFLNCILSNKGRCDYQLVCFSMTELLHRLLCTPNLVYHIYTAMPIWKETLLHVNSCHLDGLPGDFLFEAYIWNHTFLCLWHLKQMVCVLGSASLKLCVDLSFSCSGGWGHLYEVPLRLPLP